jgi:pimeloyl-ACP methyl ester carboxylesterase
LFFLFVIITGCSTNEPLDTLYYNAGENAPHVNMIIFLRGRSGSHEDFDSEGFVNDIRVRKLPFDMAAPNAHLGYYFGETLVPRLKTDVIEFAKTKGYSKFWLVGVSMGGLGALMYTLNHPDDIQGVCLISPFLGYDKIIREISSAGGVRQWEPGEYDPQKDWQRMLWHWLKRNADNDSLLSRFYLGYGTDDSFVPAIQLLGDLLPPGNIFTTSGGHTPKAMKQVWLMLLENNALK